MRTILLIVLSIFAAVTTAEAKGPKYDDPKNVDRDYAFQGEYVGTAKSDAGEVKFGIQVIALGNGQFNSVTYRGGLPGDGWDMKQTISTAGKREGDAVVFTNDHATGTLRDGVLTVAVGDRVIGTFKKVVRKSPTLGKRPPRGAVVLFDGSGVENWKNGRMTPDGLLMQGTTSKRTFSDFTLHIEFRLPYQPEDRGQARGNSGIYLQGRYEVQMLDSFGLTGEQNECGGLYSVAKPRLNMCFPPLTWQTYDIQFRAARYKDGNLVENPRVTVQHNGVLIHDNVELPGNRSTTAAPVKPGATPGPIYLQDHGCPVRYRNIWVVEE